jgi:hypothetical protein
MVDLSEIRLDRAVASLPRASSNACWSKGPTPLDILWYIAASYLIYTINARVDPTKRGATAVT